MKVLLTTLLMLSSLTGHAFDVNEIVEECKSVVIAKLEDKAIAQDAELDESSITPLEIDNKLLSPSVVVWFKANAYRSSDNKRIFVTGLTEKPVLPLKKPCF